MIIPSIFSLPIQAVFTSRTGGVSQAPYSSLNLGLSTSDSEQDVLENRSIAANELGLTRDQMAIAGQVHGSDVRWVTEPGLYPGFDGLVTDTPHLILSISAADCASVLFADQRKPIIGACHAGWRGHVGGVINRTIDLMRDRGADLSSVVAYISPCISVEHFEVGPEVTAHFADEFVERRAEWEKPHINLSRSIEANIIQCGINPEHIERSKQCTFGEPDQFFSYRAQRGTTGRMMGLICIKTSV